MSDGRHATAQASSRLLVSDFDGTMARHDFYRLAYAHLVPPGTPDFWEDYLAGRLTHFEALNCIFRRIRADEVEMMDVARQMELDAALPAAVQRLQRAGWKITVASAGCEWYIRRLLTEQGVEVEIHANPGTLAPERGMVMTLPTTSPYFSPSTGINKEAVMRDAVRRHQVVAFAGDGPPDLPAALLAPPERRFARGWLAERLAADGEDFQPFEHWSEIADRLL